MAITTLLVAAEAERDAALEHVATDHAALGRAWALIANWRTEADVLAATARGMTTARAELLRSCAQELHDEMTRDDA